MSGLVTGDTLTVLGFDYGTAKIGVAVGNTVATSACALTIIRYRSKDQLFAQVGDLIEHWSPDLLVVGRPLSESGTAIPVTTHAVRFANRLHGRYRLPVHLVDERFSSLAAQSDLRENAGGKQNADDDAVAAAIILRQYLDEYTASK